ncbi:odorant receptor Or2-like [Cimex lectularius]|uniref:Odorant receptor n=1 Tax=Cimex lectularius TaxID=79782 RepID=A0A8I6S817_CIMLE|nr:odorant receptor Or2-like [Cimex lectularius]
MGCVSSFYDRLEQDGSEAINAQIQEEFNVLLSLSCFYMKLDKKNRYWQTSLCFAIFFFLTYHLVQFMITAYLAKDQLVTLAFSLSIAITYLFSTLLAVLVISSRRDLNKFIRRCISNFYEYKNEDATDDAERLRSRGKKERIALLIGGPISVGLCILFVLFMTPLVDKYSPVKLSLEDIPKSINVQLPVAVWLPVQVEDTTTIYALSLLQIIAALPIGVTMPAAISTYMFCVQQITIQMELLNDSLVRLETRANRLMKILFPYAKLGHLTKRHPYFQYCVKECLKENVKHHQSILLGFDESFAIINKPLFCCNYLMTLMIAVSLTGTISSSATYGFKVVSALMFIVELAALSIIHFYGQKLMNLSQVLRERLYETNWTSYNSSIRSMLVIMLERTKRPLAINPLGLTSIKWETFAAICNSAYTYTNLMMALEA